MFVLEIVSWLALSLALVTLHIGLTPGGHVKPGLTVLTAMLWGAAGGMLGTVIRLGTWRDGAFSVTSLALAGCATVAFILLEWMANQEHRAIKP
jgi:hypothetical protein